MNKVSSSKLANNAPQRDNQTDSVKSTRGRQTFADYLLAELWLAYYAARLGKRRTMDEHRFELRAVDNLCHLRDSLLSSTYHPGRGVAFIIHDPVMREIVAAPFRDRVVHHFIFNVVADWWDRRFSYDSYSCRKGKGTLFGQQRLLRQLCLASQNYTQRVFVAKLDIQGYFMSLNHQLLYERALWGLEQQFYHCQRPDAENGIHCRPQDREQLFSLLKYLWHEIIFDQPMQKVTIKGHLNDWKGLPKNKSLFWQPPCQGIVIGNLTSQLLSNIYLDQLDRFITLQLGYKYYGRYVDDFYIIVPAAQRHQLLHDIDLIEKYLRDELKLTLHPKKRSFQYAERGIPFIGAVVYPGHINPSRRAKNNFHQAAYELTTRGKGDVEGIVARLGGLCHINSKQFLKHAFECYGWEFNWDIWDDGPSPKSAIIRK